MKLVALLFTFLCFTNASTFRICSFNIQSFGESKCAKPEVMDVIVKVVSRCDIMLLMEIKDSTDKVIKMLMEKLNRKQLVVVKDVYQYLDHQDGDVDAFSREPFVVWFKTYKSEFVIIPQHTTPEAAVREIDELYDVYLDVKQKWKTENFIFMGDFNAGCSYVPKKYWKNIRLRTNEEFVWLIEDNVDTTVKSSTTCAYDRIVLRGKKLINSVVPGSATVFDFMNAYGLTEAQALEISDHYPVEFQLTQMRKMKPSLTSR
ncbi:deoxyribonuclease gamma isoform X2 [Rhinoderma darwinii]|uniref:deoxyribonuclease gamma isoform X2 n=1 Tax=Rhinoderma darwinii TaxID=43563 RepID=UPI003F67F721